MKWFALYRLASLCYQLKARYKHTDTLSRENRNMIRMEAIENYYNSINAGAHDVRRILLSQTPYMTQTACVVSKQNHS